MFEERGPTTAWVMIGSDEAPFSLMTNHSLKWIFHSDALLDLMAKHFYILISIRDDGRSKEQPFFL